MEKRNLMFNNIFVSVTIFLIIVNIGISATASEEQSSLQNKVDRNPYSLNEKKGSYFSGGVGFPICGFAVGIIRGSGCLSLENEFIWINVPIQYLYRFNDRLALGAGLMPSFIMFAGLGVIGGHIIGEVRVYAIPDWLYFNLDVTLGFPLVFSLSPSMGHSFAITDKVHLFLENQFTLMVFAGVYGYWQAVLGVEIPF